jgi:RimJ/RimL family protein N-acetyltransferase
MNINFLPLTGLADLTMLQSWWNQDEELRYRICFPTLHWFDYVTTEPTEHALIAYEGDEAIGSVQWALQEDGTVGFDLAVRPDIRGQGYGRRVLHAFLQLPELAAVPILWGGIEPDNEASLRCCRAVGFTIEPDPEDPSMMKAVYRRYPA